MADNGGYISLSMRHVLTDFLQQRGCDPLSLLGPRPVTAPGELARYEIRQFAKDLNAAKEALAEPFIGLMVGQTIEGHHLGVLGYVVQHCRNLAEAQLRLERYLRLIYDGNGMNFQLEGKETIIRWGLQQGYHGSDVDDFLLSMLVAYARRLVGKAINPSRVEFVNPRPESRKAHDAFFGCPVTFEADETRIGMYTTHLLMPIVAPDPQQCERLDQQAAQELAKLPNQIDAEADLRDALVPLIRRNEAKLESLAQTLNCSPRTLQRRLQKSGRSFQDVLDQLRFEMACMYMDRPELELVDVSLLCGFSEHSAFTRAFTRWAGEPPSQFRQIRGLAAAAQNS